MSLLQYSSKEMFSATDLVRKNKFIFDKLNNKEIEKAVILRDGKPAAILLDFNEYEKIIEEYIKIKYSSKSNTNINSSAKKDIDSNSRISDEDYKNALIEIENLGKNIDIEKKLDKAEALKDFWN